MAANLPDRVVEELKDLHKRLWMLEAEVEDWGTRGQIGEYNRLQEEVVNGLVKMRNVLEAAFGRKKWAKLPE